MPATSVIIYVCTQGPHIQTHTCIYTFRENSFYFLHCKSFHSIFPFRKFIYDRPILLTEEVLCFKQRANKVSQLWKQAILLQQIYQLQPTVLLLKFQQKANNTHLLWYIVCHRQYAVALNKKPKTNKQNKLTRQKILSKHWILESS